MVKLNILTPTPAELLGQSVKKTGQLWLCEEAMASNCVGKRAAAILAQKGLTPDRLVLRNLGDTVPRQGTTAQLQKLSGLDGESIARDVLEVWEREKAAGRASG